jgi:hypothetical protein
MAYFITGTFFQENHLGKNSKRSGLDPGCISYKLFDLGKDILSF